jgi:hypothetical protein
MPVRIINRDDNPEEFARVLESYQKFKQCEMRGHGELLVDSDGFISCRDCKQGLLAGPENWKGRSVSR